MRHGQSKTQLVYPAGEFTEANVRDGHRVGAEALLHRLPEGGGAVDAAGDAAAGHVRPDPAGAAHLAAAPPAVGPGLHGPDRRPLVRPGAAEVDVLVVISPQGLDDKARYAIDQYLMRGGAVVMAAGNYDDDVRPVHRASWACRPIEGGLSEMLASYGVKVDKPLVMDPQNEPFPVPVRAQGGQHRRSARFRRSTIRSSWTCGPTAWTRRTPSSSKLAAVTLNWASPVTLDATKNQGRQTAVLLKSSKSSWLRTDSEHLAGSADSIPASASRWRARPRRSRWRWPCAARSRATSRASRRRWRLPSGRSRSDSSRRPTPGAAGGRHDRGVARLRRGWW